MSRKLMVVISGVAFAVAAGAAEAVSDDSFTMFNIIPSRPGGEELAAKDAAEFAERTGNPYCLYSLTLHPQGRPAMKTVDATVASFRTWKRHLEGTSVKPSILLQAIIGHWTQDLAEKDTEPWQRAINCKGVVTRYCPLDPGYRAYIRETARKLAACGPAMILSDDDVRAFSPLAECTCPLHAAEYGRRIGRSVTPEAMRELLAKADWRGAEHRAFTEMQRDTVAGVCALIREGIDSVDPSIPSGVCEPGWPWARRFIADNARAMAGKGHVPFARLANGQYYESSAKSEVGALTLRTMSSAERLRNSGVLLLDEADTWPHNLWSKSSVAFSAKLATSAFIGLKGAKLWLVNAHKGRYPVSRHYTEILERNRGFHAAVSAAVRGSAMQGLLVPCHAEYPDFNAAGTPGHHDTFARGGWVQNILSWYGVPFTVTEDYSRDGIYALGGREEIDRLTDGEIRAILAHRAIVEGDAVRALVKRGFGDLLGVEIRTDAPLFTGDYSEMNGDFLQSPRRMNPPVFRALPGARALSTLIWRESSFAKSFERVAPSAVLYRNRLGGTVAALAYHFGMGASYIYSEARQQFVYGVLDALNGAPFENCCANAQNVMALARRCADGADLVLAENLSYDDAGAALLRRGAKPSSVEEMDPHGAWRAAAFAYADGIVTVPGAWPSYGVRFFRLRP